MCQAHATIDKAGFHPPTATETDVLVDPEIGIVIQADQAPLEIRATDMDLGAIEPGLVAHHHPAAGHQTTRQQAGGSYSE